ncbi:MAG: hypothetical protein JWP50_571 [Phenylobacterium sp.]|nr:hypothetical protein [Phenylobacterium sp.]
MSRRTLPGGLAAALLLAACATTGKTPAPVRALAAAPAPPAREMAVKAPAQPRAPCVPKALPPAPRYPDSDTALRDAGGAADRYQLLAAGRILRTRRLATLERVVEACR